MLIDLFLLLLLFGVLAIGFFHGIIRVTVLLIAWYFSEVLASLYATVLGLYLEDRYGIALYIGRYTSFIVIFLAFFLFLAVAGLYTFRHVKLPLGLRYFDRVGGVLVGLILAAVIIGNVCLLLWYLLEIGGIESNWLLVRWASLSAQQSFALHFFQIYILPWLYILVEPFFPEQIKVLFESPTS